MLIIKVIYLGIVYNIIRLSVIIIEFGFTLVLFVFEYEFY